MHINTYIYNFLVDMHTFAIAEVFCWRIYRYEYQIGFFDGSFDISGEE